TVRRAGQERCQAPQVCSGFHPAPGGLREFRRADGSQPLGGRCARVWASWGTYLASGKWGWISTGEGKLCRTLKSSKLFNQRNVHARHELARRAFGAPEQRKKAIRSRSPRIAFGSIRYDRLGALLVAHRRLVEESLLALDHAVGHHVLALVLQVGQFE